MKYVLTIWLMLIFLPVVSCKIIKLCAKPGEYVTIPFGKHECNSIHWTRNDTDAPLCSCASDCTSSASRYNCSNQDLYIKFDPSVDTYVIKVQCGDATEYYTFCKPNGSLSINPRLGILFLGIITVWVIAS